jgi:hypothetical protein
MPQTLAARANGNHGKPRVTANLRLYNRIKDLSRMKKQMSPLWAATLGSKKSEASRHYCACTLIDNIPEKIGKRTSRKNRKQNVLGKPIRPLPSWYDTDRTEKERIWAGTHAH